MNKKYQLVSEVINLNEGLILSVSGLVLSVYLLAKTIYRYHFSAAAKSCSGLSSINKDICIYKAEILAARSAISKIKSEMNKCHETIDPKSCNVKMLKLILKYQKIENSSQILLAKLNQKFN